MQTCHALFPLGKVIASHDVYEQHSQMDISLDLLLQRHVLGDWGMVSDEIRYQNNRTLRGKGTFESLYLCRHHWVKIVTTEQTTTISILETDD